MANTTLKMTVQLWKNRGLGPLGPSILDPIYVIYVFGSMLSCILCEWQKFSESHKIEALWCPESVQSSAIFDRFLLLDLVWMQWN